VRAAGTVQTATLSLVSIPTWLSRRADPDDQKIYQPHLLANPEKARFILESLFRRLERTLDSLQPAAQKNRRGRITWPRTATTTRRLRPRRNL